MKEKADKTDFDSKFEHEDQQQKISLKPSKDMSSSSKKVAKEDFAAVEKKVPRLKSPVDKKFILLYYFLIVAPLFRKKVLIFSDLN